MRKLFVAVLLTAAALSTAVSATADPEDLLPWCSAGQTPANDNCRAAEQQHASDSVPGADPEIPLGVNPGVAPIV